MELKWASGQTQALTDAKGEFQLTAPKEPLTLNIVGKYLSFEPKHLGATDPSEALELHVGYSIPPVHESLVISATALNPIIDQRNDNVYKSTLFSRDDQIFDTLAAGINTGQHEGGGKSLEIRRYRFQS